MRPNAQVPYTGQGGRLSIEGLQFFDALAREVEALRAEVTTLQSQVATLETQVADHETRITALEP